MGKKKKKAGKNRQAKALKHRTKRKQQVKKNAPKRRQMMAQMPGGMAGAQMSGAARKLMAFAEPLINAADPQSMEDMQGVSELVQGFWTVLSQSDDAKRAEQMAPLRIRYEEMPWASVDFDELSEYLLRRHIHFLPDTHSREERERYSEAEIQEALESDPFATAGADISELSDYFNVPDLDGEALLAAMDPMRREMLTGLHDTLKTRHGEADFIDADNPVLNDILTFQNQVLTLFGTWLEGSDRPAETVAAHKANLSGFFEPYLRESHQSSLFTVDAEQVEEYAMDFAPRKLEAADKDPALLLQSLAAFFVFTETLGYSSNAADILAQLREIEDDYRDVAGLADDDDADGDGAEE